MSLYRGRIYTIEDMQKLIVRKLYIKEMLLYDYVPAINLNISRHDIEHNLIQHSNAVLLLAIDYYHKEFIDETQLNLIYDKITTYNDNSDILGKLKVHKKINNEIVTEILHSEPFEAYIR